MRPSILTNTGKSQYTVNTKDAPDTNICLLITFVYFVCLLPSLFRKGSNVCILPIPASRPKLYLRYIGDIFAIFDKYQDFTPFLNWIYALHRNLEFTVEVATSSLPFLDVNVKLRNIELELSVYRKLTNTNVIINFSPILLFNGKLD